jgi:hypothetical protein
MEGMEKQTAVEWLTEKLRIEFGFAFSNNILEQAKEMEKEQIIKHSLELAKIFISNPYETSGKMPAELIDSYINETFKSETIVTEFKDGTVKVETFKKYEQK